MTSRCPRNPGPLEDNHARCGTQSSYLRQSCQGPIESLRLRGWAVMSVPGHWRTWKGKRPPLIGDKHCARQERSGTRGISRSFRSKRVCDV